MDDADTIEIMCFKLHKVRNPFVINEGYNPFITPSFPVNWNTNNSYELSEALNNQVRNNLMEFDAINIACEDYSAGLSDEVFTVTTIDNEVYTKNFNVEPREKLLACKSFLSRIKDLSEVISRDQDALNYDKVKVQLYTCVLLYNGEYQGHIYAWMSPYDTNYCFVMGIRNRLDSIFTRYTGSQFRNASHYLLEGVRRFATIKGSSNLYVVYPRDIMIKILPTLGFHKSSISTHLIGDSIAPKTFFGVCNNCYKIDSVLTPIIGTAVNFSLSE